MPIELYNIIDDPTERHNIAGSHTEILRAMLSEFNQKHWREHPPQFDWSQSCLFDERLYSMPSDVCARRTSHLSLDMNLRSISNTIACRFEQPFIRDDDPSPCGNGRNSSNIKAEFKAVIASAVKKWLAISAVGLFAVLYVCVHLFHYSRYWWSLRGKAAPAASLNCKKQQ